MSNYNKDENYNKLNVSRTSSISEQEMLEELENEINMEEGKEKLLRSTKRGREEDDSGWTKVVNKEKKPKTGKNKIEIYISSNEIMPKQFCMAKILKAAGIKHIERVKYVNPFKVRIDVTNEESAEKLETSPEISGKGWKIQRAFEKNVSHGVIRGIDLEISEEDILNNILCPEPAELMSVYRLKRRSSEGDGWEPSETIRLCFKGSFLPSYISVHELKVRVDSYVFPVTQCGKCWKLGHVTKRCPSTKVICPKCADHHANCETTLFKCANCSGRHMALARTCPAFLKEKRLRELMAEYNCTYRQALILYIPPSETDENIVHNRYTMKETVIPLNTAINTQDDLTPTTPYKKVSYKEVVTRASIHEDISIKHKIRHPKKQGTYKEAEPLVYAESNAESKTAASHNKEDGENHKNVDFAELLSRLKEIILLKGVSMQYKIHRIIKCCVEWFILLVVDNVTDWPILKILLDYVCLYNG